MEWELNITYHLKPYNLRAELAYHSTQIMRIRVHGMKGSLLLENNYPSIRLTNSKRGIKWHIKEGKMDNGSPESARLLANILEILEHKIKKDFNFIYPDIYP